MTEIFVAPDLGRSRIGVQGIITVDAEQATIGCSPQCMFDSLCLNPARVSDIPYAMHGLEAYMLEQGKTMVARLKARGYHWLGELRFHGPFVSHEFATRLTDLNRSEWAASKSAANADGEEHREKVLPFVYDEGGSPYMDYVLVGDFVLKNVRLDQPVEVTVR